MGRERQASVAPGVRIPRIRARQATTQAALGSADPARRHNQPLRHCPAWLRSGAGRESALGRRRRAPYSP